MTNLKIAVLQLPTLPMSDAKLDYYLRICKTKKVSLVLLGEYVLNSFFKELETMPIKMIKEQSEHKLGILKNLSTKYDLTIVAPVIIVKNKKIFKVNAKFSPTMTKFYEQNILMPYKHWNEQNFFANHYEKLNLPVFTNLGIRIAIVNGFEVHFDKIWLTINEKKVDLVLVPSVCAFESNNRWSELLKTMAFTHNVYILRANRVGVYNDKKQNWYFYGKSSLINPYGESESELGDNEEILIAEINKENIIKARKIWKWIEISNAIK